MQIVRLVLVALCLTGAVRATSVIPPSFDELVGDAELIFRGEVTGVRSGWVGDGARRRIATWVTFAVEHALRGTAGATLTLEFLGGSVGEKALVLAGWPSFAVGERGVFFVENRQGRICPLVRLRHGRYRIVPDPGAPAGRVVRDDGSPLRSGADVAVPLADAPGRSDSAPPAASLSLAAFETAIAARSAVLPLRRSVP